MSQTLFRFQDLQIWKKGAPLSAPLFQLADHLEQRKLYRFAEQLRGATLSITNNIAEGSGSNSDPDFANFLNIARRSVFEVANILMLLAENKYIDLTPYPALLPSLEEESKIIYAFIRTLRS